MKVSYNEPVFGLFQGMCRPVAASWIIRKAREAGFDIHLVKRPVVRGRPRLGEVRDKPWLELGMSRRTWFRREAEKRAHSSGKQTQP